MFTNDATWYLKNVDKISAFEKWIEIVKSDLPKQIFNLVKRAAGHAVNDLNNNQDAEDDYSAVYHEQGSWGYDSYWWFRNSWKDDKDSGAWIEAYVPKNIEWLTSESDDLPQIALCYYSGRKIKESGAEISKAVKRIPASLGVKVDEIDDEDFVCVKRLIHHEINATSLAEPGSLEGELAQIFKEFTEAMRPGLESACTK